MSELIERLKRARERSVEINKIKFTVRRPTDMEIVEMREQASNMPQSEVLKRFVVDWSGVKESDLVPGGTGVNVPFDSDLFMEWVVDQPKVWSPLSDAITEEYEKHVKALEKSEKKPENG